MRIVFGQYGEAAPQGTNGTAVEVDKCAILDEASLEVVGLVTRETKLNMTKYVLDRRCSWEWTLFGDPTAYTAHTGNLPYYEAESIMAASIVERRLSMAPTLPSMPPRTERIFSLFANGKMSNGEPVFDLMCDGAPFGITRCLQNDRSGSAGTYWSIEVSPTHHPTDFDRPVRVTTLPSLRRVKKWISDYNRVWPDRSNYCSEALIDAAAVASSLNLSDLKKLVALAAGEVALRTKRKHAEALVAVQAPTS